MVSERISSLTVQENVTAQIIVHPKNACYWACKMDEKTVSNFLKRNLSFSTKPRKTVKRKKTQKWCVLRAQIRSLEVLDKFGRAREFFGVTGTFLTVSS